jgi:predicted CXXCH cytochrome family protein
MSFAGRAVCVECHTDEAAQLAKGSHARLSCEVCHGPNQAHADDQDVVPEKIKDPKFCLRCHQANPARPPKFPQIEPAEHNPAEACQKCHVPHAPTDAPAPK